LKQHNNSAKKSEPTSKRAKSRGPVQRDTKEVLAELVGKLREKLDPKVGAASAGEKNQRGELRPNLDRLTVGVDLGDHFPILHHELDLLQLRHILRRISRCRPRSANFPASIDPIRPCPQRWIANHRLFTHCAQHSMTAEVIRAIGNFHT
jgi:hypothetical protein